MSLNLQLTEPQAQYLNSPSINTGFVAGFGSGKSFIATLKMILWKLDYPGVHCAYYLPSYGLVRDIAYDKFPALLTDMKIPFNLNKSAAEIEIIGMRGKILFRSMNNPETIVGYEVGYTCIDECDILPMDKMELAYNKILSRNRYKLPDGADNKIDIVGTPEGFKFFYKRYVTQFREHSDTLVRASTYSNPFLPKAYIQQLEDQYPENLIKAYLGGEFTNLTTGNVYSYFDREIHDKRITDETIAKQNGIHIGLDFNTGGCISIGFIIIDDIPIAISEFVTDDTFTTITSIQREYSDKIVFVYPDAAGNNRSTSTTKTDISLLKEAGFVHRGPQANPAIKDRVNSVNGLLNHNRFFVDADRCPKLVQALEQQAYDDKGSPEKFNVHPAIDDYNDAMGYFLHRKFGINKTMAKVHSIRL